MAPPPVSNVLDTIGNTPCLQLRRVVPEGHARVFIKLESLNPTGSYKDRMARSIIEEAERRGDLQPGMTVVEATGGSTGSSLAFVCAVKGYAFRVVSSDAFAQEKIHTMSAFGSTVELIKSPTGKITSDLIPSMRERAREISEKPGCYLADQFNNNDVLVGYERLGCELIEQFPSGIDGFCGAIGGAGMVMGVSKVLKSTWPECLVAILEPASAPVITEGRTGTHGVEGIGIGFVPPLLDKQLYDEARAVPEDEARAMCRRLAKEEGILVGTSTGLNVVAAIALAKNLGPGKTVVTVACDTGLKDTVDRIEMTQAYALPPLQSRLPVADDLD
ncbi:tryptophan synthase beta subunit-like PLP-dependent enzyme [Dactylonectria macrodidyma]|uniref:Tryptophan synthase beta subunit-like PLP-dependent enzyme n=1 Tax=Dactylonectria macrodidyma TaxID=307937 RepID=A0A9P9I7H7_9HYPO|nr:tryptophan synthase beta subunit-like PLP-dependent enzyme [Dactylonectria macrodidyma]